MADSAQQRKKAQKYRIQTETLARFMHPGDTTATSFGFCSHIISDFLLPGMKHLPHDTLEKEVEVKARDGSVRVKKQFEKTDVSFVVGALEFEEDPKKLIDYIAKVTFKTILLSYPIKEFYKDTEKREERGWRNHLTKDDIVELFTAHDFMVSYIKKDRDLRLLFVTFKSGRKHAIEDNFLCCGCSACIHHCPQDCIYEKEDKYGYIRTFVDYEKCILCGKCSRGCPVIHPKYANTPTPKCYAFENDNKISSISATAGGFQVVARHFIANGGKVVGAAWTEDEHGNYTKVRHIMADNESGLERIYRSKYVQSEMGDIYAKTIEELEKGTRVLFSGVPCQIAGLYSATQKHYDNLYTIDLICHSTPAPGFFRKYMNDTYGENKVKEFHFRGQGPKNGHKFNHKVTLNTGESIYPVEARNLWYSLYNKMMILPEACENCRFCGYPRQSDLTLADFHKIRTHDTDFKDGGNTELALLNTQKGTELFEIIRPFAVKLKEKDLELVKTGNKITNFGAHPMRDTFREWINNGMTIEKAADAAFNYVPELHLSARQKIIMSCLRLVLDSKKLKKLSKSPRRFFEDSNSKFIKFLGQYYL